MAKPPTMIAIAFKEPKKGAKKTRVTPTEATPATADYKEPSPHEMKVNAAHRAHRDVVESWVRGDASDNKVKQSHTRLKKIVTGKM